MSETFVCAYDEEDALSMANKGLGRQRTGVGTCMVGTSEYRVTVERVTDANPETVTEPEKKWWACDWNNGEWSNPSIDFVYGGPVAFTFGFKTEVVTWACGYIHSATAPTYEQFAEAVKAATGVVLPVAEEKDSVQDIELARISREFIDRLQNMLDTHRAMERDIFEPKS